MGYRVKATISRQFSLGAFKHDDVDVPSQLNRGTTPQWSFLQAFGMGWNHQLVLSKTTPLGEGPWDGGASCGHFFPCPHSNSCLAFHGFPIDSIDLTTSETCRARSGFRGNNTSKPSIFGSQDFHPFPQTHSYIAKCGVLAQKQMSKPCCSSKHRDYVEI